MRYCVMQPYFFPYAGYYRLMFEADVFVIFDNAQFPRRGRVHRCQIAGPNDSLKWLTLPVERASRSAKIAEIRLATDAPRVMPDRLSSFPDVAGMVDRHPGLRQVLLEPTGLLVDYLDAQLRFVADAMGASCRFEYASQIRSRGAEDYQDYVIGIGHELGADQYVNAPGGRALYEESRFQQAGLGLRFLPTWQGPSCSLLQNWEASTGFGHPADGDTVGEVLTRGR